MQCIMDDKVYKLLEQMPVVNGFRKDSCVEVRMFCHVSLALCCTLDIASQAPSSGRHVTPHSAPGVSTTASPYRRSALHVPA